MCSHRLSGWERDLLRHVVVVDGGGGGGGGGRGVCG